MMVVLIDSIFCLCGFGLVNWLLLGFGCIAVGCGFVVGVWFGAVGGVDVCLCVCFLVES